ncbi:10740_t:CDS:1, partial [Scutellospora calospora]
DNFMGIITPNDFRPTFPPSISENELVNFKENGEKPLRISSSFIYYRKMFVREFKLKYGRVPPMTKISPIISQRWKEEPECVKETYANIVSAAKKQYEKLWPEYNNRFKVKKSISNKINVEKLDNLKQLKKNYPKINIIDNDKFDDKHIENKTFENKFFFVPEYITYDSTILYSPEYYFNKFQNQINDEFDYFYY